MFKRSHTRAGQGGGSGYTLPGQMLVTEGKGRYRPCPPGCYRAWGYYGTTRPPTYSNIWVKSSKKQSPARMTIFAKPSLEEILEETSFDLAERKKWRSCSASVPPLYITAPSWWPSSWSGSLTPSSSRWGCPSPAMARSHQDLCLPEIKIYLGNNIYFTKYSPCYLCSWWLRCCWSGWSWCRLWAVDCHRWLICCW